MDQLLHSTADPVFWWWEEDGGARVLLLSGDTLVLSGLLDGPQITDLEGARQQGNVLAGDFGKDRLWVETQAIREMRYVPSKRKLELLREGGTDSIQPPVSAGGVAAGAFEVLRDQLAPDAAVQDVVLSADPKRIVDEIRLLAGLTVFTLVTMGLAFAAEEEAVVTGLFSWLRQPVNDIFAGVGLIPAAVGGSLAILALIMRGTRRLREKRGHSGPMVRVLTIGGPDVQAQAESVLQSVESFDRPLLGPVDDMYEDDDLSSLIPVSSTGPGLELEPGADPFDDAPLPPADPPGAEPFPYVPVDAPVVDPAPDPADVPLVQAETPAEFVEIFDPKPPRPAWATSAEV